MVELHLLASVGGHSFQVARDDGVSAAYTGKACRLGVAMELYGTLACAPYLVYRVGNGLVMDVIKIMKNLIIPKNYKTKTDLITTQLEIKFVKDEFEKLLAEKLNLIRVSAPILVLSNTGINDDLNGVERAVRFDVKELKKDAEIVHSLAK